MTTKMAREYKGLKVEKEYGDIGGQKLVIEPIDVTCIKIHNKGVIEVGKKYTAVEISPDSHKVCLDFQNGSIGWYPLELFNYDGKPKQEQEVERVMIDFTLSELEKLQNLLGYAGKQFESNQEMTEEHIQKMEDVHYFIEKLL